MFKAICDRTSFSAVFVHVYLRRDNSAENLAAAATLTTKHHQ